MVPSCATASSFVSSDLTDNQIPKPIRTLNVVLGAYRSSLYWVQVCNPLNCPNCLAPVLFDLACPDIWDEYCQRAVDQFREELRQWHCFPCDVCNRILPFYRKTPRDLRLCSHCINATPSKFGAE